MTDRDAVLDKIDKLHSKNIKDSELLKSLMVLNPSHEFYTIMLHLLQDFEDNYVEN
jgi:hypothetical protein